MCIGNYEFLTQTKGKSYKAYRYWGRRYLQDGSVVLTAAHHFGNSNWSTKTKTIRARPSQVQGGDIGLHAWRYKKRCSEGHWIVGEVIVGGRVSVFGDQPPKTACPRCHTPHVIKGKGNGVPKGYLSTEQTIVRLFVPGDLASLAPLLRKRYKVPVTVVR